MTVDEDCILSELKYNCKKKRFECGFNFNADDVQWQQKLKRCSLLNLYKIKLSSKLLLKLC